jgi:hypothetical protein
LAVTSIGGDRTIPKRKFVKMYKIVENNKTIQEDFKAMLAFAARSSQLAAHSRMSSIIMTF